MIALTKTEQLIVDVLAAGDIVSLQDIYDGIDSWASSTNTVKWHISHIRQKLGSDTIISWRGRGYSLRSKTLCPTCARPYEEPA